MTKILGFGQKTDGYLTKSSPTNVSLSLQRADNDSLNSLKIYKITYK